MNGMSMYARRVAYTNAIAGLMIGAFLMFGILFPILRGAEKEFTYEKILLEEETFDLAGENFSLESANRDLKVLISDIMSREALISTFLEAGYTANTIEEIKTLLSEASLLPFGSPFENGHRITAEYGVYTIEEFGWLGVNHPGIDLVPLDGDRTIYSTVEGTVVDFGYSEVWGKNLTIQSDAGYQLFYAHLDRIYWTTVDDNNNWSLTIGDHVKKGTRIAEIGQTGSYATGVHLHFEIRVQVNGSWVTLDPKEIIKYVN